MTVTMAVDKHIVADAVRGHWADRFLPPAVRPYARLARLERPIGWWLLLWPCWWSSALATDAAGGRFPNLWHLVLFLVGAIVMRGAGCTYNDIVDRDLDAQVARTRSRPIPSGQVTTRQAVAFLVLQALVGLAVLLQFNGFAIVVGIASLVTVAIYPFMKRITWWPQVGLGIAFSWGALMGWAAIFGSLVVGAAAALSRRHFLDDRLRHYLRPPGQGGRRADRRALHRAPVRHAHAAAARPVLRRRDGALRRRLWFAGVGPLAYLGLAAGAVHLGWQVRTIVIDDPDNCLMLFRSNRDYGWIVFAGSCGGHDCPPLGRLRRCYSAALGKSAPAARCRRASSTSTPTMRPSSSKSSITPGATSSELDDLRRRKADVERICLGIVERLHFRLLRSKNAVMTRVSSPFCTYTTRSITATIFRDRTEGAHCFGIDGVRFGELRILNGLPYPAAFDLALGKHPFGVQRVDDPGHAQS